MRIYFIDNQLRQSAVADRLDIQRTGDDVRRVSPSPSERMTVNR